MRGRDRVWWLACFHFLLPLVSLPRVHFSSTVITHACQNYRISELKTLDPHWRLAFFSESLKRPSRAAVLVFPSASKRASLVMATCYWYPRSRSFVGCRGRMWRKSRRNYTHYNTLQIPMRQEQPPPLTQQVWTFLYSSPDALAATQALLLEFTFLYPYTFSLTMYIVGRPATYAAQLLFSLFVTNSALPTTFQVREQLPELPTNVTLGFDNEVLVRLPNGIPWSPGSSTFKDSVLYHVPNTAVTLNFTHFGYKIPVLRALSILSDAHQEVQSHLASGSADAPINHSFEYSTPVTSRTLHTCSVVVQTYGSLGLSWLQLDQILEGLMQFSSGAGVDHRVHYQALQFEINLADTGRVAIGLLWCTPGQGRGLAAVEERAEAHQELDKRVLLMSGLSNETSPKTTNASRIFPIPGTDLSLSFVWLGGPIPSEMVNEALHGAFFKIAPFLADSGDEHIPKNRFLFWIQAGRDHITIQVYGMIPLTWSQLNAIIAGLFRYSNGIGTVHEEEHFKNMGFDVKDEDGGTIGYGNLLAIPAHKAAETSTTISVAEI